MRTIIGEKIEMTQIYSEEDGRAIPVTIVDVNGVKVVNQLKDSDKVTHVVIGKGQKKNPNKAEQGKYKTVGFVPAFIFAEVVDGDEAVQVGDELGADLFEVGAKVDVTGVTKGKGYQGVVKRWGFKGGPKTHGQSDKWRSPGSIGSGTTPGRVYKGKKMGGHMGNVKRTKNNLRIVGVDAENGYLLIRGAVPGPKKGTVIIQKSKYQG